MFKFIYSQVGAVVGSLCKAKNQDSLRITEVQCASIKSNMGHMEPSAASAGLVSLAVTPLLTHLVAMNVEL